MIKKKAKSYAETLGISDFTATNGWLSNFKKSRHNLVFKKINGESANVKEGICDNWKLKLQDLYEYDSKNVFNTDETELFFKCLPDQTFTFKMNINFYVYK